MRLIILAGRMISGVTAPSIAHQAGLVPRKAAFSFFGIKPIAPFTFHALDYPCGTLKEG